MDAKREVSQHFFSIWIGLSAPLWECQNSVGVLVHLDDNLLLPLNSARDGAFQYVVLLAEANGYLVSIVRDGGLAFLTYELRPPYFVRYNNAKKRVVDVRRSTPLS